MFTYWVNAQIGGDNPYSYHVVNVLLHCATSGLVFLIVRRLLGFQESAGAAADRCWRPSRRRVFLLHPVQTETVAYLAGRSEGLSVLFVFAAFTVFLYRRNPAASWGVAAAVLVLFGAAVASKEHTVSPGGAPASDGLLVESRLFVYGHSRQLESVCAHRRRGGRGRGVVSADHPARGKRGIRYEGP